MKHAALFIFLALVGTAFAEARRAVMEMFRGAVVSY
jgi:hypothetical protein